MNCLNEWKREQQSDVIEAVDKMSNKEVFISIAEKYIGVSEQPAGSNRGPLIDRWNTNVHVPLGSFWCASFVSGIAMEWEDKGGEVWPLCFSADCDVWLAVAKKNNCLSQQGKPGDLVLLVNGDDAYHIGIVTKYSESGTLVSVEGNSNNDGSRNGYIVAERQNVFAGRNKKNVYFINPWHLIMHEQDWKIVLGDKHIVALNENGKTYAPVREMVKLVLGDDSSLVWNDGPELNGSPIGVQCILRENTSYCGVRDISRRLGYDCIVNSDQKKVYLKKKST